MNHTLTDEVTNVYELVTIRFLIDPTDMPFQDVLALYEWAKWEVDNAVFSA